MSPRVFISSTINDLLHLRDAIRDQILELGYDPVMSEHGEIGYLPTHSAADSCYIEAQQCHFGILIIGKRYGEPQANKLSVTHNEYKKMLEEGIPMITLVEKDILAYKRVFDENRKANTEFPGMNCPDMTFGLISEVTNSQINNGISEFTHISDARQYIKKQIAHIFTSLLHNYRDPLKGQVRDILAEVMALRQELSNRATDPESIRFLRVSRLLLEDWATDLKDFFTEVFGSIEVAVKGIIECPDVPKLLAQSRWTLETIEQPDSRAIVAEEMAAKKFTFGQSWWLPELGKPKDSAAWAWYVGTKDRRLRMNLNALHHFNKLYLKIRAEAVD